MLIIFVYLTNKHVIIIHHVCSVRIFTQLYDPKKLKVFEKKKFSNVNRKSRLHYYKNKIIKTVNKSVRITRHKTKVSTHVYRLI